MSNKHSIEGLGDVPPDWSIAPLGDFVEYVTYGFTNPMPDSDAGPFKLTAKDVNGGRILYETARHTTWEAYNELLTRKSKPAKGDVLLTKDGSIGRVAVVDRDDVCINQSVAVMRPRATTDARFLAYLLQAPYYQDRMAADSDGSTIKHIYITRVDKMLVAIPSRDEQQAIAAVLGSLDDKIEQNRRMGRALERLARATFKAWFVDFEPVKAKAAGAASFPGLPAAAFASLPDCLTDSPLGAVPEGWAMGTLGDLLSERGERVTPGNETRRLPYVPIDCITSKRVTLESFRSGEEAQSSLIRFQEGDVLFGAMRPYFHKVCLAPFSGTTRTTCFVLVPRTDSDRAFALMLASEDTTVEFATTHSVGSTIPYAKWQSSLREMPCVLPSETLRAAFGVIVDPLLHLSNEAVRESAKLATLRDYLLPRLLSGQVRVRDLRSQAEVET